MTTRYGLIFAAPIAAMLVAGCATQSAQGIANDDKVYVTGSRIPVKESAPAGVKATTDRKAIEDLMRRPGGAVGGVTGAGGS